MSTRGKAVFVLVVGAVLIGALVAAPWWLRGLETFTVEDVQVEGTRYLAPHDVLSRSGITERSNVFEDPGPWRDSLLVHPLVADVRIERRLPRTLVVVVTEVEPVALVPVPDLRPVDRRATVLPIDPVRTPIDLPILDLDTVESVDEAVDAWLADTEALRLIRELERLRRLAPSFAARVSEIGRVSDGGIRIVLRRPSGATVLLPSEAGVDRLGQLTRTLDDLKERDELDRARRIDVRYRDQVVVSLTS